MDMNVRSQMRNYVVQRLRMKGDGSPLGDQDLLFSSGRLDSLDAVEIVICLETDYGINFSEINFDLTLLDSVDAITELVEYRAVAPST
jgi:acyl carrier protein